VPKTYFGGKTISSTTGFRKKKKETEYTHAEV
jgi:hypothetical protein